MNGCTLVQTNNLQTVLIHSGVKGERGDDGYPGEPGDAGNFNINLKGDKGTKGHPGEPGKNKPSTKTVRIF